MKTLLGGMLSNLARIYRRFLKNKKEKVLVIFIRTDLHVVKHIGDFENCIAFSDLIEKSESNFEVVFFNARNESEWLEKIKAEINRPS